VQKIQLLSVFDGDIYFTPKRLPFGGVFSASLAAFEPLGPGGYANWWFAHGRVAD
jgi:hypothetical protein